jgi:hypothetical protein
LRFPYHPFQKPAGNVGVQSMANLPIGRNESVCDVYSSCWPWQAQAAATVAPTHQDTLNPWIPILVNTGFFELTKATTPRSIVMSETAAPFANPSNNNMWTVDIGRCAVEAMRPKLVWVERQGVWGWGCSKCVWVFKI